MFMEFDFRNIEKKWRARWEKDEVFRADDEAKEKKYILDMFPYPSGDGLHVGHPRGYIASDILARYFRHKGYSVLHPIGWDAFGLPAENFAIKTGTHPHVKTQQNIETFRKQLKLLGFSYDWSREVNTSDPAYYQWTQWLFLQLYKKGLAYKKEAPVNWCDSCKTVLANEQVINGECERCGGPVEQRKLKQWFFKITDYVQELLDDIDHLNWSDALKTTQKNWIGKSEGALIEFKIQGTSHNVQIFTTRPDTIFGATFLVLAPEHSILNDLRSKIENQDEVKKYIEQAQRKTELERKESQKEKTGVRLKGVVAINPANQEEIPVFIADYVLTGYGTGAIMAVPAHDQRDFEFAKKFDLNITSVIEGGGDVSQAYEGSGNLIHSGEFTGMSSQEAWDKIIDFVKGEPKTIFKLRDWLISRQRYWGAPIPIIYCEKCGEVPVPEKDLPVRLPEDVDFKPTGESPLTYSKEFHNVTCPTCGGPAKRESDTMDTFVCSSWYYLRYTDPHNSDEIFDKKKAEVWMPVDIYVGGMEHAVGHLLYSRFITKALRDQGLLDIREPFTRIINQGLILAEDGRKMSKRWGNVINPDSVVEAVGADTLRMYEMFMGPLGDAMPWNHNGMMGTFRFLNRVWAAQEYVSEEKNEALINTIHRTIKKVSEDIEETRYNTAISSLMITLREFEKEKKIPKKIFEQFIILLSPFAPFIAEELWEHMGHDSSISKASWPEYEERYLVQKKLSLPVQVNGKTKGSLEIDAGSDEQMILGEIKKDKKLSKYVTEEPKKVIFVPDRIINLIF